MKYTDHKKMFRPRDETLIFLCILYAVAVIRSLVFYGTNTNHKIAAYGVVGNIDIQISPFFLSLNHKGFMETF